MKTPELVAAKFAFGPKWFISDGYEKYIVAEI